MIMSIIHEQNTTLSNTTNTQVQVHNEIEYTIIQKNNKEIQLTSFQTLQRQKQQ
jgi:hypothetical protein